MTDKTYIEKLQDPRWQRRRLEIMHRDGFACRVCGATDKTLHTHHDFYVGEPWEAPNAAMVTLCSDCHDEREIYLKIAERTLPHFLCQLSNESIRQLYLIFNYPNHPLRKQILDVVKSADWEPHGETISGKEIV